jgi:ATP-dependent DNA helicase RecG
MTATPIPRTLTAHSYGEMDVSRLDEMPPGRSRSTRASCPTSGWTRSSMGWRGICPAKQAYWVCPLVEESENSDLAAAERARRHSGCASAIASGWSTVG